MQQKAFFFFFMAFITEKKALFNLQKAMNRFIYYYPSMLPYMTEHQVLEYIIADILITPIISV